MSRAATASCRLNTGKPLPQTFEHELNVICNNSDMKKERLLFAEECAALVEEVTGQPFSIGSWRVAVSRKTKTNPAPDPAVTVTSARSVRPRPKWRALEVLDWALNRPGRGAGREAADLPGYWHAGQCAQAAGITRAAWWDAVAYKTSTNPAPPPVPTEELPDDYKRWRYWRPDEVEAWITARPGRGNRARRTTDDVEADLPPGEWTTRMCAKEAGVSAPTWSRWMREDRDAPRPLRRDRANLIWSANDVRAYLRRRSG